MKSTPLPWSPAWALLAVLGFATVLFAQDKDKPPKPITYTVVKVGEEVRILEKSQVKAAKAQLDTDYKSAVKAHQDAAAAARKAKEKFDQPRPKKAKWKVLKATCKSEEDAKKFVAQLEEKARKKQEASGKRDSAKRESGKTKREPRKRKRKSP